METPLKAKQQGEAADNLIKQLNEAPKENEATPPAAAAAKASEQEVQTPPTQGNGELEALQQEHETLKQKHSTLQRKYDLEVPRYAKQVRELKAENKVLRNMQQTQAEQAPAFDVNSIRAEYGDEVAAIAETAQTATKRVEELSAVDQARREAAEQEIAQIEQQNFDEQIEALVPGFWSEKNNDPEWIAFLNSYAPNGETWKVKAERERDNGNAQGVASIYNVFAASKIQEAPAQVQQQTQVHPESQPQADPREELATPKTGGAGSEPGKRIWTGADASALYAEKTKAAQGLSQFTIQELDAQEADLFAAQREGRYKE